MNEMVERVARAMHSASVQFLCATPLVTPAWVEADWKNHAELYRCRARAAIDEMRRAGYLPAEEDNGQKR